MPYKVLTTTASDQCYGYQTFVSAAASFLSASVVPPALSGVQGTNPQYAEVVCELGSARYRCDGVLVTVSSGMPMVSGQRVRLGVADFTKVSILSTTCTVTVEYWGEPKPAGSQ